MALSRLELLGGAAICLLVGAGLTRVATPARDRPPLRRLSIEGIQLPAEPIASGQTLVREASWKPTADVYVVGWAYSIGGMGGDPELLLLHEKTVLFFGPRGGVAPTTPAFYAEGVGFKVYAGQAVTLRLSMVNEGPPGTMRGANALVYFVPADAN